MKTRDHGIPLFVMCGIMGLNETGHKILLFEVCGIIGLNESKMGGIIGLNESKMGLIQTSVWNV